MSLPATSGESILVHDQQERGDDRDDRECYPTNEDARVASIAIDACEPQCAPGGEAGLTLRYAAFPSVTGVTASSAHSGVFA